MIITRANRRHQTVRERRSVGSEWLVATVAVAAGLVAWAHYFDRGLVLSHYDAKAHLVVARRVVDGLTPGWQQIGAVWLPLPHLIQILPTQIDFFYRTGVFASMFSVACFGTAAWAAVRLTTALTGSMYGGMVSAALLILNPNLLYLQATPMTEPLLIAVTLLAVLWLYEWVEADQDLLPAKLRAVLFAAAWTRYEAWAVLAAAFAAAAYAMWRRGVPASILIHRMARLVIWPAAAVLLFLLNSRMTVGHWFVSDGFYVPDPEYQGRAGRSLTAIWWGTHRLSGYVVGSVALAAAVVTAVDALRKPEHATRLIAVGLFAAAALPLVAFYEGHPFRIRYMVPVVAAGAVFCGIAVGLLAGENEGRLKAAPTSGRRRRGGRALVLAAVSLASALVKSPPWAGNAPLISEAQWDVPNSVGRRAVTRCLGGEYQGEKILASMGSLAHYMQELSHEGFALRDFVHEGTGTIWHAALDSGPAPHAGWMLVEEEAEGGDVLARRIRDDAAFTRGMTRVCEGGGVALYRRMPAQNRNPNVP